MDGISALERSYDQLAKQVAQLSPSQLSAPTVCGGWDVRGLLNHTLGAAWMFTLVNRGESVGEDGGDLVADDPAGALAHASEANLEAWRQQGALAGDRTYPFGTFPAAAALMMNVGEVAIHSWDLAQAMGQEPTIDSDVAQTLYDFYAPLPLDEYRAHGAFGPEVPVPESASVTERLLGYLGRRP